MKECKKCDYYDYGFCDRSFDFLELPEGHLVCIAMLVMAFVLFLIGVCNA